jgi:hypothetical protein
MKWRSKPKCRPRRSAAASRFVLESLEDRTALATTWSAPQLVSLIYTAVETRLDAIRPDASLNVQSAQPVSDSMSEAALPVPAWNPAFGPANVSSSLTAESTVIGAGVVEHLGLSAPSTAAGGATISAPEVPGGIVGPKSSALGVASDLSGSFAGPRATELVDFMDGTTTPGGGAMGALDQRFGDAAFMMSPPPEPGEPLGFVPGHSASPSDSDEKATDMSLSGPVLWTDTDTGLMTWMSLSQTAGRSAGRGSSPIFAELALQMNPTGELGNSSGLLYLATAGSTSFLDELSAVREGEVLALDQGTTESDPSDAILDAGITLSNLLSGINAPIPTEQGGVEQIAELIPLSESSLALAATLWTVRSDSQASAPGSDLLVGAAAEPAVSSPTPKQWAVFMTGVDRAFEQTFRDVQVNTLGKYGWQKKSEDTRTGLDDRLQWLGPILPGAAEGLRGGKQRSTRPGHSSAVDESSNAGVMTPEQPAVSELVGDEQGDGPLPTLRIAQPEDSEGQLVVQASTPVLWVASISSIVAGWFWGKRRERRQRSWREGKSVC